VVHKFDLAESPGNLSKRLAAIERAIRELAAARRLESSSIGAGGVHITDGGSVIVEGGGVIRATSPDGGQVTLENGRLKTLATDGPEEVQGQVFAALISTVDNRPVIYMVPPRTSGDFADNYTYVEGGSPTNPGNWVVATSGDVGMFADQTILFASVLGELYYLPHTTTGSAANAVINSVTGLVQRSTSSARYKRDIEDLDVDPAAVLRLRPRTWRDRAEVERGETRQLVGLVAEEVAGELPGFVDHDETGRPEAVQYDRLTVALLAVVQEQAEQIADLTARLAKVDGGPAKPARRPRTGRRVDAQPAARTPKPRRRHDEMRVPPRA
jgi:hypothetical protein